MPKATPSISVPVTNIPQPASLKYQAHGELRFLLGGLLLQAVRPAPVLYLLLARGRAGLPVLLRTVPASPGMTSGEIEG